MNSSEHHEKKHRSREQLSRQAAQDRVRTAATPRRSHSNEIHVDKTSPARQKSRVNPRHIVISMRDSGFEVLGGSGSCRKFLILSSKFSLCHLALRQFALQTRDGARDDLQMGPPGRATHLGQLRSKSWRDTHIQLRVIPDASPTHTSAWPARLGWYGRFLSHVRTATYYL